MRTAVIDLGTNTFDLIIVERLSGEPPFKTIYTDKSFVQLGKGGINDHRITDEAMERARFALDHFVSACRDYKVDQIHAFGTSALRDAKNGVEFKRFIHKNFSIDIDIIAGKEEARLIYEGIRGIHTFDSLSCIMDIGGGSTEFIFADENQVYQMESLNIGISRMLQLFNIPDYLNEKDIKQLEDFMDSHSEGLFNTHDTQVLIGAAGSFETFFQIYSKQTTYSDFSTHEIPLNELETILNDLISSSLQERTANFWIPDYRRKMIHIAAVQTRWVIQKQQITRCYFSPAALKEGVLFSAVD